VLYLFRIILKFLDQKQRMDSKM